MYNESGFSVKNFILKIILVVLFVFLLMWLFPMPNLKPVYDRLFAENVETMKTAAKSYYTVERLPKEVNQTVKMTLDEMLAMKLVLPIVDSTEAQCDGKASYVEIMKTDTEYVVKTNLTCSNKADYVIEHMGCYNLCSDSCVKEEVPVTPTPQVSTPTKSVPKPVSTPTIKPVDKSIVTTPVSNTTLYQLTRNWYKGYTNNTTAATTQYKHVKYATGYTFTGYAYSCPSGYTASGSGSSMSCYKYVTTYTYSCPSGYTSPGGVGINMRCDKATTTYTYSCPSGYTSSGSGTSMTCSKSVSSGTSQVLVDSGSGKVIPTSTSTYKYISTGSNSVKDCSSCPSYILYTYNIYKVVTNYTTTTTPRTDTINTSTATDTPNKTASTDTATTPRIATPYTAYAYQYATGYPTTSASYTAYNQTAQYSTYTYIADSKWTYNSYEAGYTLVDSSTISGNTSKVYTPDWVLTLPSGYTQTEIKAEYKWASTASESGWTYAGATKQVSK